MIEIKYMTYLKENFYDQNRFPRVGYPPFLGLTKEQITLFEEEMCTNPDHPKFPEALVEFLLLAGREFYCFRPGCISFTHAGANPLTLDITELMGTQNMIRDFYSFPPRVSPYPTFSHFQQDPFKGRPYWGFLLDADDEKLFFVYLDESIANPPVYLFDMGRNWDVVDPDFEFHEQVTETLSAFVGEYTTYLNNIT